MIKANELRIGNLIEFKNLIEPAKIVTITARFFSSLAGGRPLEELKPDEELNGYYHPIPISPQWLERLGFERCSEVEYLHPDLYPLEKTDSGYNFSEPEGGSVLNNDINFVHQLQNAVYILTGEELQITDK